MIPRPLLRSAFVITMLFMLLSFGAAAARPISAHDTESSAGQAIDRSAPLSFVSNVGQLAPSLRFEAHANNKTLWFASDSILLNLSALSDYAIMVSCANPNMQMTDALPIETQSTLGWIFDRANPVPALQAATPMLGTASLFTADDPLAWRANEALYGGIVYHELYPGVDLSFAGQTRKLTAIYTLAAGVDPSVIAWHYVNADSLYTNTSTGDLHVYTADGGLLMSLAPVGWQMHNGEQTPVSIRYENTSDTGVRLAASLSGYDPTLPLTISFGMD